MEENFNKTNCIETLRIMFGNKTIQEISHYDTLNYYLEDLYRNVWIVWEKRWLQVWFVENISIEDVCWKNTQRASARYSIKVTNQNVEEMILAERGSWKIENEGFNNQKNGLYRIENLNSRNSNGRRCILHFQIHNGVSRITSLF